MGQREALSPHLRPPGHRLPGVWIALILVAGAAIAAYVFTATQAGTSATNQAGVSAAIYAPLSRDLRLYRAATTDAGLADSSEEQTDAAEAVNLADQIVDSSFTIALQEAAAAPAPAATAQAATAEETARVREDNQSVIDDQAEIAELQNEVKEGRAGQDAIHSELDVESAQLSLDQARLTDAKSDESRGGVAGTGRLQELQREHEATHAAKPGSAPAGAQPNPLAADAEARNPRHAQGLVAQLHSAWLEQDKISLLGQAQAQAQAAAVSTTAEHDQLQTQLTQGSAALAGGTQSDADRIAGLQKLADTQQIISRLDQQTDTATELADTYAQWIPLARAQRRLALHDALGSLLDLLAVLGLVLALLAIAYQLTMHRRWDRKRATTLRHILGLLIEIPAAMAALMILFGQPTQLLTVIGLCGAGLTVAFQDAILSAAGWFALMGRYGIRLGDWVEINGVTGEVIEIRLLKTVLLETGNWISAGHPTGRKVFFPNSYALKGAYFNFSTSGQWLWDEVQLAIPAGITPERALQCVMESVNGAVAALPGARAEAAGHEWKQVSSELSFSTAPTVQLRPVGANFSLVVRYTTPASERAEARARIEGAVIKGLEAAGATAQAAGS